MKTYQKIIGIISIILTSLILFKFVHIIVGITFFIIGTILIYFGFIKRYNKPFKPFHSRQKPYEIPSKKIIDQKIQSNNLSPKNIYMMYHDLDCIPNYILDNIKTHCKGYNIEIYGLQKCEDFLYEYYGADAMQLFREIKWENKVIFWTYCILYIKGGYCFDIQTNFDTHIDNIFKKKGKTWYVGTGCVVSLQKNPVLWAIIQKMYNFDFKFSIEDLYGSNDGWNLVTLTKNYINNIVGNLTLREQLYYKHNNLPPVDKSKLDIPILYINMDKDVYRRKFIEEQLQGVDNIHRIEGVVIDNVKTYIPKYAITKNEMGCFMAHINAIKKIISSNLEKALIIEDDVSFRLSSRWDKPLSQLKTPMIIGPGTSAYILDKKTAINIVNNFNKLKYVHTMSDNWVWEQLGIDIIKYTDNIIKNKFESHPYNVYFYTYQYNVYSFSTIVDRTYSAYDSAIHAYKIATNTINNFSNIKLISIDKQSTSKVEYSHLKLGIFNSTNLSDRQQIQLKYIINKYIKQFDIEIYLPEVSKYTQSSDLKYFDLSKSNIDTSIFHKFITISPIELNLVINIKPYIDLTPTYISMTTIPNRLKNEWFYKNLQRSLSISADYTIVLNTPDKSLKGVKYEIPDNIKNLKSNRFMINKCGEDLGPITKLIPTLKNPLIPDDAIIIVCDDDIKYKEHTFVILRNEILKHPHGVTTMCYRTIEGYKCYGFVKDVLKGILLLNIPKSCERIDDDIVSAYVVYKEIPIFSITYNGDSGIECSAHDTTCHPPWEELREDNRTHIRNKCLPSLSRNLVDTGPGKTSFTYLVEKKVNIKIPHIESNGGNGF